MKMMNKMMIRAVGVLIVCLLPLVAFAQQDWQSTSALQGSGSSYSPQVTAVGATDVNGMATTTETNQSQPKGPNRAKKFDTGADGNQSSEYPLGDTFLPLLLMSLAFGMFVYFRHKRSAA